ncbi:hypothetical protein QOZ80_5AG0369130 [Eleusine coracana subsp. coracana]|nr:hypothetical protein QOZ80_5AG0369130 [Eleusine coracana subsp. coracana]
MIASSAALGGELPAFGERLNSAPASARATDPLQDPVTQLFTSPTNLNDEGSKYDLELSKKDATRHGFWALVAQKAKVMLDENGTPRESHQPSQSRWSYDRVRSAESPLSRRGSETKLDIGGKIKNVLEKEGLAMSESRPGGGEAVSPAVRRLQVRRKASSMDLRGGNMFGLASPDMSPMMSDTESPQIMASRDVASAMAAKVKLLQRELKTVKADLTFSKERCAQLEEENRLLRDGNHNADEDLIRQQLETLLGEKARLANENTVYARENRFLREIVEFHQLNMQDVVNLDDDDDIDEEEYDEDIEEEEEDVHAEPEFDQYDDLGASSPSHCLQEEEGQFPLPDVLDTTPLSPSQKTQPGLLMSTNSGGTIANESPRMPSTNSGSAIEDEMHRSFKDDCSSPKTRTDG